MPKQPLRIIFAGTPDFAALHLATLIDSEHQLLAVYTQPDRPAGRGKKLLASPVKQLALEAGLPIRQPASLKEEDAQKALDGLAADIMIVVAYGLILPQAVLDAPRLGCLNVHASLLPRWRGAAPIQRAIEAGDDTTGITIMQMDAGLDTGAMLATAACTIPAHCSAADLHDKLARLGPPLLLEVLQDLSGYQSRGRAQQDDLATYARKMTKAEACVNWLCSARELDRRIRAFNPFPVCYSSLDGQRIRIWQAQALLDSSHSQPPGTILRADGKGILVNCGDGQLLIERLQLPGGKVLTAQQVLSAKQELFSPGRAFDPAPGPDS